MMDSPCPNGKIRRRSYTRKNTGKQVRSTCVSRDLPNCPPGQIPRSSYVRHLSEAVQQQGYTRKTKKGNTIQVRPRSATSKVKATCIKNSRTRIGPLKKGQLKKFGYVYKLPEQYRRKALKRAISALGPLNVYHKLDAISKLTVTLSPKASAVFTKDKNWVRSAYAGAHAF